MSESRRRSAIPTVAVVGVIAAIGVYGLTHMHVNPSRPRPGRSATATPTPTASSKLVLHVGWTAHRNAGVGLATYRLLGIGEQDEELSLVRRGDSSREVINPLGLGAAEYEVQAWHPTDGYLACDIYYYTGDGRRYQVAAAFTNNGGGRLDPQAHAFCRTTTADIKSAIAKKANK